VTQRTKRTRSETENVTRSNVVERARRDQLLIYNKHKQRGAIQWKHCIKSYCPETSVTTCQQKQHNNQREQSPP